MARKMGRTNRRDVFVNRYRGSLTSGAAGAVAVESFNTGMNVGRTDPMKWVIVGFQAQPSDSGLATFMAAAAAWWSMWQLVIGTVADLVAGDDMQCICEMSRIAQINTTGFIAHDYPIVAKLPGPIPVFAQTLTVVEDHANVAQLNSIEWDYEIDYFVAPTDSAEIGEYLAAFGQV